MPVYSNVGKISAVELNHTYTYQWVINKFCVVCKTVGDKLISPEFSTFCIDTVYKWQMSLYPKGETDSHKDWLAIHLQYRGEKDVTVIFSFNILNNKNEVVSSRTSSKCTFTKFNTSWGYSEFEERAFITNTVNGILNDDKLTIICEIVEEASFDYIQLHKEKPNRMGKVTIVEEKFEDPLRLQEFDEFETLIDDTEYSDVELTVEGKVLRAHKCILAKRSPVFAAMFQLEMKEKQQNIVEIKDIKHEVFVEVLRFLYAGKVNDIDKMAGELLAAADQYSIEGLKPMCEKILCKNLKADNAAEYLKLADLHRVNILKTQAIEIIVTHAKDIIDKPEFKQLVASGSLHSDVVCEIFRAMTLNKKM